MDELTTGAFELSVPLSPYLKDWQVELAKEELVRRIRTALERIQRLGATYTSCIYPVVERDERLVLTGFFVLAQWQDCEIDEACSFSDGRSVVIDITKNGRNARFKYESTATRHYEAIYIYRRMK